MLSLGVGFQLDNVAQLVAIEAFVLGTTSSRHLVAGDQVHNLGMVDRKLKT